MRLRLVTHTPGFMPLTTCDPQADCRHHASGTLSPMREQFRHLPNPELLVIQLSGEITSLCRNNKA
jgi:hypothetical protein